jgi:hypothetical protein
MTALDAALLAAFIVVGIMLLRLRQRAAIAHTCLVAVAIIYAVSQGFLWVLPRGIGASIAGAGGVADLGIGVLLLYPVPFLYPVISIACVNIAQYRLKKVGAEWASAVRFV